jgi:hypothetical protein
MRRACHTAKALDKLTTSQRGLQLAEDRRVANQEGDEAEHRGQRTALRGLRGENGVDELSVGRTHESFKLHRQLPSDLLPLDYHPGEADDE